MSEWTVDTLREQVAEQMGSLEGRQNQRINDLIENIKIKNEVNRHYLDSALASQKEATEAAMRSSAMAINKAEAAAEKRFEGVNEFRNTLSDQQRTLMPRQEAEVINKAMLDKLQALTERMDRDEGRGSGVHTGWLLALGVVSLISVLISIAVAIGKV